MATEAPIAVIAVTTTGDSAADRTANFDKMNGALEARATRHFSRQVSIADSHDEMNLLVAGNGYHDGTAEIPDIYEAIICDEDFYDLINGMTEEEVRGLADEALTHEGYDAYFPGLIPETCSSRMLADYLTAHPEDWMAYNDSGWSFDGDPADVAAFAVEHGAVRAETIADRYPSECAELAQRLETAQAVIDTADIHPRNLARMAQVLRKAGYDASGNKDSADSVGVYMAADKTGRLFATTTIENEAGEPIGLLIATPDWDVVEGYWTEAGLRVRLPDGGVVAFA